MHFLTTPSWVKNVENTTQIENNKKVIKQSLKVLYQKQQSINIENSCGKNIQAIRYKYPIQEIDAIIHFNLDKRFAITD